MKRTPGAYVQLLQAHAIVTGAAQGVGLATCVRLAAHGCRVSMWDIDGAAAARAAETVRATVADAQVLPIAADVTQAADVVRALEESRAAFAAVHVLINNAGHMAPGHFHEQPTSTWDLTLQVNCNAIVALTRAVIDEMYAAGCGHIVNIRSAAGTIGVPGLAAYCASKWAVWGFSEALRAESRRRGVMVSSVHPGYIADGMFAGAKLTGLAGLLVPRLRSHDVVAKAVVEAALVRGRTRVLRPRTLRLVLLLRGLLPAPWFTGFLRVSGVAGSMDTWRGRAISSSKKQS